MGRPKTRTEHSVPQYAAALLKWGMSRTKARRTLGVKLDQGSFWRVLRCEDATPQEVKEVEKAIREYGQKYNLPGWKEL